MLAIWVKVRVKPQISGSGSWTRSRWTPWARSSDEPGCLRFNVLQDVPDENVYYFYEVYTGSGRLEAHRAMPHYAVWRGVADTLEEPTLGTPCIPVFPADRAYWGKP